MTNVDISFNCGCGARPGTLEAAIQHADTRMHTITVLGTIYPNERAGSAKGVKPMTAHKPAVAALATAIAYAAIEVLNPVEDKIDFSILRARLQKKGGCIMPKFGEGTKARDDLVLFSKHADVAFREENGNFALFWFNTPKKGKCLSVECNSGDYPAIMVTVFANWKNKRAIAGYRKNKWIEEVF